MRQVIATQHRTFAAIAGHIRQVCFVVCCLLFVSPQPKYVWADPPGSGQSTSEGSAKTTAPLDSAKSASANTKKETAPVEDAGTAGDAKTFLQMQQELEKRRDEAMQIRKRLLEPDAEKSYDRIKFTTVMRSGTRSAADRKIFDASLRYRILEMANEDAYRKAGFLRNKLLRDLKSCGYKIPGAVAKRKFRQETLAKVVAHCESMYNNQLIVRINAVRLVGHLDLEPGTPSKLPTPYVDSYTSLLKVVNDPQQLPSVKISAARGLQRILQLGAVANAIQDTIANDTMKIAVKGNPAFPWLDEAICETMAEVKTAKDARLQQLLTIMADRKRAWRVRTAVAYALGRTGWNPNQADLLAYRVTQLLHQIAASYNRNPKNSMLTLHAFDTYLAYHHDNGENKAVKIGLLKRQPTGKVKHSFEKLVVPTLNHMMNAPGRKIPAALMDATAAWLQENAEIKSVKAKR